MQLLLHKKMEILPENVDSKHWWHRFMSDTTQLGATAQPLVIIRLCWCQSLPELTCIKTYPE